MSRDFLVLKFHLNLQSLCNNLLFYVSYINRLLHVSYIEI